MCHAVLHQDVAGHFQNVGYAFAAAGNTLAEESSNGSQFVGQVRAAIFHIIEIHVQVPVDRSHEFILVERFHRPDGVHIEIQRTCARNLVERGHAVGLGHRE